MKNLPNLSNVKKTQFEQMSGICLSDEKIGCTYLRWYDLLNDLVENKKINQITGTLHSEVNNFCVWGAGLEAFKDSIGKGKWEGPKFSFGGISMSGFPNIEFVKMLGFDKEEMQNWVKDNDRGGVSFSEFAERVKEKAIREGFLEEEDFE